MGQHGALLLAALLVLGLCVLVGGQKPSPCRCSRMNISNRKNCGFPGISKEWCFIIGCCYDSKIGGIPWCYHPLPNQEKKQCIMEVSARYNCGYPGITIQQCASRKCCFSNTTTEVSWCFFPKSEKNCHY